MYYTVATNQTKPVKNNSDKVKNDDVTYMTH